MEELNLKDLSPYLTQIAILEKTAAQIQKDFGDYPIVFTGNTNTAYDELFSQVYPIINFMWEKQQQNLWNILYQIDLDEKKVLHTLYSADEPLKVLTDMILKRELKKVLIRLYYSK